MWCNAFHSRGSVFIYCVSMPHAAFYVVQPRASKSIRRAPPCFNAARGFLCGATKKRKHGISPPLVSMPHAAFYVVQLIVAMFIIVDHMFQCRTRLSMWCNLGRGGSASEYPCFNAARGFLCGATSRRAYAGWPPDGFNAARGFLCGATTQSRQRAKKRW